MSRKSAMQGATPSQAITRSVDADELPEDYMDIGHSDRAAARSAMASDSASANASRNSSNSPQDDPSAGLGLDLRPRFLTNFIGQSALKSNLQIYISATKQRNEALEHLIFHGPPGLGKTTLAHVIANELEANLITTTAPLLSKAGDLAAILSNLQPGSVLFIDEIHRLSRTVEELLYSAMEDFVLDLIIGEGPAARSVRINLAPFTLIGATTRLGLLSAPFRDRFGIPIKLDFYAPTDLGVIIQKIAQKLGVNIAPDAALEIAKRARGTPRIAIRLFRRVRDFAEVIPAQDWPNFTSNPKTAAIPGLINLTLVHSALNKLGVDAWGLDELDRKYLQYIATHYRGGPVGIETIVSGMAEDRDTIEASVEAYLMQIGFVNRTPKGRTLTSSCSDYLANLADSFSTPSATKL